MPIPKKGNDKEYSNYHTTVLISHASKMMRKILQSRLQQQYMNGEIPDVQDLEKAEEPEIKVPTPVGEQKKQENSRRTPTSASLTMLKPLTMWITTNCGKFLKRWEYQTTCLLRNLYAGQEANRKGHGMTDRFRIGKGIR